MLMRERWRIVIHRKRGLFKFLLRDGYLSKRHAETARLAIWRRHQIRWLKVESYYLPKEESMRRRSLHYSDRHEAVGAVACPVCQQPKGVPCVVAATGRRREQHGNETHVGRVRKFESQREENPFAGYHPDDQAAAASANMPDRGERAGDGDP